MKPVARLGDIGVGYCYIHGSQTGKIVTSSLNVIAENSGVARYGDLVIAGCGHSGTIVSTSTTVLTNNRGTARVGDVFAGIFTGTITKGANTVLSG